MYKKGEREPPQFLLTISCINQVSKHCVCELQSNELAKIQNLSIFYYFPHRNRERVRGVYFY
jgi:hypothetical protein